MKEPGRQRLGSAIEGLYRAFSGYRVARLADLSCYDFGPIESELAAVTSHPLREIPQEALAEMGMGSGAIIRFWENVDPVFRREQVEDPWEAGYSRDPDVLKTIAEVAVWVHR